MRNVLDTSLKNLRWIKIRKKRKTNMLLLLSFVVALSVFWGLRQPGLTLAGDASCGIVEHTHDDTCGTETLVCGLSEGEPHIHDDFCYETFWILEREEVQLVCEEVDETHIHTDDCYETIVTQYKETDVVSEEEGAYEEEILICELPEEVHMHEDDCYEWDLTCELEEHVHRIECYSDATADVETVLDWEEMFEDYPYTGDLREDLVGIAKTQVGYSESELNFEVDDDGIRRGYTRYGAWYGTPYRDWSAMFVSFCLNYAGADSDEVPGNTGANSMIKRWDKLGKYAPAGEYTPVSGDLVFFDDKTVGIIAEVNDTTIYVIRGDVDNEVCTDIFALTDDDIIGWGSTVGTVPEVEDSFDIGLLDREKLLDISDGPVFYIFAGGETEPQMKNYFFRNSRAATNMLAYLEGNGGNFIFTLLDKNNQELPKDENENYIAEANTTYKMTLTYNSPYGFLPGTYEYQVPYGLEIDGGEGEFIMDDGTNVGSWVLTDTGLITMVLNENMNNRTDVAITSAMGVRFPEQDDPIEFDGSIIVKVEPPSEQKVPTELSKWGSQGSGEEAGKINWSVRIDGHADSKIPGNILTDQTALSDWSRPHQYTESDMAAGITFGVNDDNGGWHNWHVTKDDPNLTWDEKSWSYKIPEMVICDYCGELKLGNEGWIYQIDYSSTPTPLNTPGSFDYENKVTIDGQTAWGWSSFVHSEIEAGITKKGSFVSDASGGAFLWEVQAAIPGREEGERAEYSWFIMDEMRLLDDQETSIGHVKNDIHLAVVTATYDGTTIEIPRIQDATDEDMFAWDNAWTAEGNHTRTINLVSRCQCTPETCHWTGCGEYWFQYDNGSWDEKGFCQCWTETRDMTFTFVYRTEDLSMIENYGSLGYHVNNHAILYYMEDDETSIKVSFDDETVKIPNLFEKALTKDFENYTAHYKITVNEGKLELTDGNPLHIEDEMTDTLAYISGSLVITAEDKDGDITTLKQDVDYTVTYDGTGNQTDGNGRKVHVMDIVILHPQPVMYIIDYDTTLVMPDNLTGAVKYSNSAKINLWGKDFSDDSDEKVFPEINISSKSYKVEVAKISAVTGEPLGGAVFGLYNENGGLITSAETDSEGKLYFETNIIEGIFLREHIPYYVQEVKAPSGYRLDDTKQWFCFCDHAEDYCETCSEILPDSDAVRIPVDQIGIFSVTNEYLSYDLPTTGGFGIYPLMLVSTAFVTIPLVYGCKQKCSRGKKRARYSAKRYRK